MNSILKQISSLFEQELYSNVVNLAELSLSFCDQKQDVTPYTKFQLYIYYGDSHFQLQNFLIAESAYSQAHQIYKYLMKTKNTAKLPDNHKEILNDVEIKYKMYLCYIKLKMNQKAVDTLQNIPVRVRTPKVNMALGDLYRDGGLERSATTCYKEVLRECPSAIEAAENLLKLGVKGTEVNSLMLDATTDLAWINSWMRGQAQMHARDYSNALTTFKSIDSLKDNSNLILAKAQCHIYMCEEKKALSTLQRAMHINPNIVAGRDLLANLLANSGDKDNLKELERLIKVDLDMSKWSCEDWIVMGWYMYAMKKYEKAAYFGHQACSMNRKNVEALLLKAHTFMQVSKYLEALVHFKEVVQYAPYRFDGHKGLVDSNFAMNRIREGLTMAANGCKQLNNSAQALTLYASALMKESVITTGKVRSLLDRALAADPSYTPAVYLLAEYLDQEQRHEEAYTILLHHVEKYPTSKTHQLLAECYARLQKDEESFTHYSAALSLDPHNQSATDGLNGLGRSPTKLDSSYYMSVTGESSSYASQGPSVPSDELEESDSDPWPSMSYE